MQSRHLPAASCLLGTLLVLSLSVPEARSQTPSGGLVDGITLGVGLSMAVRGRNPMIDGFGLIALASLTPMIFVMVLGLFVH